MCGCDHCLHFAGVENRSLRPPRIKIHPLGKEKTADKNIKTKRGHRCAVKKWVKRKTKTAQATTPAAKLTRGT